jgi:hypothetical protein
MKKCETCGVIMEREKRYSYRQFSERRFCSKSCRGKTQLSKKFTHWKGGRKKQDGYVLIFIGKGRYVQEHRMVMEKHLGISLRKNDVVHHKNGIKDDNRIENLEILSISEHSMLHAIESGLGKDEKSYRSRNVLGQFV